MRPANVQPRFDGVTRAGLDAQEERIAIYARDQGRCQCGCLEPVAYDDFEMGHRIANTKENRRKYGARVVNHPRNKAVALRQHNSRLNIGHKTAQADALAAEIRQLLDDLEEPKEDWCD